MGVHGLWELLAPVGRRVSVETLAGKKLAIDASIWMIQFMKAMRDEKGEMVRNAHILGFFRRICKLLYLRTKPVFVFDGGTPALKRRTVIARRRQRENAQAKIRKTAEKLLLNHLKAMRLKELAADLEKQRQENDIKGKRPIIQEPNILQNTEKGNDDAAVNYNQEELDEMLAASIAVEENEGYSIDASTSGAGDPDDKEFGGEEDDDEDEEMILPEMQGKVDPAVLAALPPSMQLDLLVQMRERLMAENRQKYQKVKKAPARFSELQIQAYLKTVAFRREIDGVQKSAAGRGIGGMQTSRIASESNREFIFSSSFTGDKTVAALTSVGQERVGADQSQPEPVNCSMDAVNEILSTSGAVGPTVVDTEKAFHDDVETYLDERGRLRVSRVRALGVRMTRDLQRNLDLMKEIEQEKADTDQEKNKESTTAELVDDLDKSSDRIQHREISDKINNGMNDEIDNTDEPAVVNGTSIEISFEDTLDNEYDNDDDKLFASLVAGNPVMDFSVDNSASAKQTSDHSASDFEWEEGFVEEKRTGYLFEGGMSSEGEVEWEEGFQDIQLKSSPCPDERQKTVRKGALQEESDIQEAIRRSLEDTRGCRSMNNFHENNICERGREVVSEEHMTIACRMQSVYEGNEGPEVDASTPNLRQPFGSVTTLETNCSEVKSAAFMGLKHDKSSLDLKLLNAGASGNLTGEKLVTSDAIPEEEELCATAKQPVDTCSEDGNRHVANNLEDTCSGLPAHNISGSAFSSVIDKLNDRGLDSGSTDAQHMFRGNLTGEELVTSSAIPEEEKLCVTDKHPIDTCSEDGNRHATNNLEDTCSRLPAHNISGSAFSSVIDKLNDRGLDSGSTDAQHMFQEALDDHARDTAKLGKTSGEDSVTDLDGAEELGKEKVYGNFSVEKEETTRNSSFMGDDKEQEIMEAHLEEEMLFLGKEREELGSEQRKLERNAESVSNEMFAECQELLQMFGLPYIIAPMEAEAQCAFMEQSNLVDGVVTDDSDAFLFGARSVYKNIFDDRKYVETYLMKDIENELGLDREKLIHMALLLGSDYTEGISGIGIVNAIEVVNAFPEKDGLREFREWIESPDPTILGKVDVEAGGNSRRKGSKCSESMMGGSSSNADGMSCDQSAPQPVDGVKRIKQIFMDKHRNVSKNWHIPSTFPSDAVISAYAYPQVDKSTDPFSWGKPDLFVLRKLCWEKFGWGMSKSDELLLPVLKEYNKHETQLRLEAFYTFNERFAKIRSNRIKKAVKGITGAKSSDLMDDTTPQSGSGKKRKVRSSENEANQSGGGSEGLDGFGTSDNTMKKTTVRGLKGGRTKEKTLKRNLEQSTSVDSHLLTRKESHIRGRHKGHLSGKGRRKEKNSCGEDTETGSDDGSHSGSDEEKQLDRSEESFQVRRSGRIRKIVNYTDDNCEEESPNCLNEGAITKESLMDQVVGSVDESNVNELNEGNDVGMGCTLCVDETEQASRMDETRTSHLSDSQIDDPFNQRHLSKDYLQFGGGFCVEEDEEVELDRHASLPPKEVIPEKSDALIGVDSVVQENHESDSPRPSYGKTDLSDTELNTEDKRQSDHISTDGSKNDPGNSLPKSLRAMPNLRRKKRKT
ncbi:DNA repair protein UVH3 [Sesamum alatum]|uniref:DNA repair protein UVH3 n=1 Tax=Sesamum alatum TaxID=300844 RepID=A0AAE2CD38_9LAMI|nr:DNA repair protein UVH3 [Sesamum alatum]